MSNNEINQVSQATGQQNYEMHTVQNIITVSISNSKILTDDIISQIYAKILSVVEETKGVNLIVNFSQVNYLSSSVLSKLISIHKKVKAQDGTMCLCNINPVILKIFELTRLDTYLNIFPDEEKACAFIEKYGS
ncbi:MAG: STAS domain-containing protein [Candidatus Auribacterota bacterium]|jgi:anti-anti-sigma factor|nr:STAS domain-containing protein [Candidatus Auribacterota bacterium]